MILHCTRCLYPSNHPLGIFINEDGICSGCIIHEEKNSLDWKSRFNKLQKLVKPYKINSGLTYDCIVPVTGANDSYFIVDIVKNKLGLNPLLVTYNKYFNTPLGIRNLANLRIKFDCDILIQNVNPVSVKNITRTTLRELGSIYWPCIAGQTVFPVQTAVRYKIPLIIWGAHQGLEQVGMFSHEHEVEMTRRYRHDHDLMGYEADDLLGIFDTLSEDDIWQFRYPDNFDLNDIGVRGIYLGNYIRWDPKLQHEEMIRKYDYKTASFLRTFDNYDHTDCFNFMDLHDHIKYLKHGFSKVTDHASREIRHKRLNRKQALHLVKHFQNGSLNHVSKFCEWIGIDERSLHFILDQHRNKKIWSEISPGQWHLNSYLEILKNIEISDGDEAINFAINSTLTMGKKDEYITIGKGYP